MKNLQNVENAHEGARTLWDYLRTAHSAACRADPILSLLLRDLMRDAARIQSRLVEIVLLLKETE